MSRIAIIGLNNEVTYSEVERGQIIISEEILASQVRQDRNELLAQSDWTQLNDSPLTQEQKERYKIYRQALRDITEQEGFPLSVVFPKLFEEA